MIIIIIIIIIAIIVIKNIGYRLIMRLSGPKRKVLGFLKNEKNLIGF
jgi:uncharacterized protein YpmB